MINKQRTHRILSIGIGIFLLFALVNLWSGSQWIYDSLTAIAMLVIFYLLRRELRLGRTEWVLIILALIVHNLGSFGFYSYETSFFGYDNIVHLFSSFAAAWITFNVVVRRLEVKGKIEPKKEHLYRIIVVICVVTTLGALVEVVEYAGFLYLGEGEGIFFSGDGDNKFGDPLSQYSDTMGDILVNTLGAALGAVAFDRFLLTKKRWLKY